MIATAPRLRGLTRCRDNGRQPYARLSPTYTRQITV